jgi:signal transduction histidine kinase
MMRRPLHSRTAQVAIWGFWALFSAGMVAAVAAQVKFERSQAIDFGVEANKNRVIAFEQYVARTLDAADVATRHLALHFATLPTVTAGTVPTALDDLVASNPLFDAVVIANAQGDVIATTIPGQPARNIAAQRTFRRLSVERNTRPIVGRPFVSPLLGKPLVSVTSRIERPDGSFGGTATVQIGVGRFMGFTDGATARAGDVSSVIRLDGITIARRTGDRFSYGEDLGGRLVMRRQMRSPNGTYLGPSSLDGTVRYFSQRRLADYPIFVTSGVSRDELLAAPRKRAQWYFAGAGLLVTTGAGLAAALSAYLRRRDREAAKLARINARLRNAQRIGRIGDWEYDPATGCMLWSEQLCRDYRRDPRQNRLSIDEAAGYFAETDRARFREAVLEVHGSGKACDLELTAVADAGLRSIRRFSIEAFDDASGRRLVVGTDQDVTSAREFEELRQRVSHNDRIEAVNAMAATIAHELAQPLAAAANYVAGIELIAERGAAGQMAKLGEAAGQAQKSLKFAADILRRAKGLIVRRDEQADWIELDTVLDDVIGFASMLDRRVIVTRRIAPDCRLVHFDAVQLQQVLLNIIRNAIEALRDSERPVIDISATRSGAEDVLIEVSDNGPGLPEGIDIFSPFASTSEAGLGLGMTISSTIVHAHGGDIWAAPSRLGGATINIRLRSRRLDIAAE